ncbi:MAG: endonuclease MutS2 [Thermoanaerobaculia bacterium]
MTPSLRSLEFDRVLELVAADARTDPGRAAVHARRPVASLEEAERLQGELAEMTRFYLTEGQIPLAGLADPAPLLEREVLELDESWLVLRAVRATQALRETFTRLDPPLPRLLDIAAAIPDLGTLSTNVGRFFTKDGKLREEASAELRSIRARLQQKRSQIQRALSDVLMRHADALQEPIVTIRADRYCVPVKIERRAEVPGILHGRSGSGASVFIEPMAIVEANNDVADLLEQEREEIARITRHVAQLLLAAREEILDAARLGGELDAIQAAAMFGRRIDAFRPRFVAGRALRLEAARHPLLDERLADLRRSVLGETDSPEHVIPTTIVLTEEKPALVISGPNAGGKTVALKTAGLLVAMALAGLPLPAADGSEVPVVDDIHVLIGDDQSVMEHLSTFSADLVRLSRILARASERSLVLLDELGSGTDPEEGGALAAAVIEHVLDLGALLVVTTHLAAVKSFAVGDARVANASMEFDAETGRPTFRMIGGVPGRSRAIEVAAMMGLPLPVVARAREKLGGRYGDIDQMVAELQKGLADLADQREEVARALADTEKRARALERELAAVTEEKKKLATRWREEMDRVRAEVSRNLQAEIRRLRELDAEERRKIEAKRSFADVTLPIDRAEPEIEAAPSRPIAKGDRAEHRMLRFRGDVLSIDGEKVTLAVAGKKMQAMLGDLRLVAEPANKPAKKQRRETRVAAPETEPEITAELNLIGQRVDDAIESADKFLDQALLSGKAAVRLIHGHGTGALRSALRDELRKHQGVRSFRPGNPNEGGDGATVVLLDV